MSSDGNKEPGIEIVLDRMNQWVKDQEKRNAERYAAEAARRAKLTPSERLREDQQVIYNRYFAMGAPVLARESWRLTEFAYLLIAEHPEKGDGPFGGRSREVTEQHKKILTVLESCIGTSLHPINQSSMRFRLNDLIAVSTKKHLAHAILLQRVLSSGPFPNHPYLPVLRLHRPSLAVPSVKPQELNWHVVVSNMCYEIENAVKQGQLPYFERDDCPWSTKLLFKLFTARCREHGMPAAPVKIDTFRKQLNRQGWKGRDGYQDPETTKQFVSYFKLATVR